MMTPPICAILYVFTACQRTAGEMAAILSRVRGMGYDGFECRRQDLYGCPPPPDFPWASLGLCLPELEDELPALIATAQASGVPFIGNSGLVLWFDRSAEDYREAARRLNGFGKTLRHAGLRLLYHNHDFEFDLVAGDRTGMDLLLQELDFSVLDLCVDVGWLWKAGIDPVGFLRQHAQKIAFLHLRDFAGGHSVPLGQGDVPLRSILATLPALPRLQWIGVEMDPMPEDPEGKLAASLTWLRQVG
jgi:sugar phosphate isomerase/epimerase